MRWLDEKSRWSDEYRRAMQEEDKIGGSPKEEEELFSQVIDTYLLQF